MTNKKKRIIHSPEFKAEALKLAEKVGVAAAARQLSLQLTNTVPCSNFNFHAKKYSVDLPIFSDFSIPAVTISSSFFFALL